MAWISELVGTHLWYAALSMCMTGCTKRFALVFLCLNLKKPIWMEGKTLFIKIWISLKEQTLEGLEAKKAIVCCSDHFGAEISSTMYSEIKYASAPWSKKAQTFTSWTFHFRTSMITVMGTMFVGLLDAPRQEDTMFTFSMLLSSSWSNWWWFFSFWRLLFARLAAKPTSHSHFDLQHLPTASRTWKLKTAAFEYRNFNLRWQPYSLRQNHLSFTVFFFFVHLLTSLKLKSLDLNLSAQFPSESWILTFSLFCSKLLYLFLSGYPLPFLSLRCNDCCSNTNFGRCCPS